MHFPDLIAGGCPSPSSAQCLTELKTDSSRPGHRKRHQMPSDDRKNQLLSKVFERAGKDGSKGTKRVGAMSRARARARAGARTRELGNEEDDGASHKIGQEHISEVAKVVAQIKIDDWELEGVTPCISHQTRESIGHRNEEKNDTGDYRWLNISLSEFTQSNIF